MELNSPARILHLRLNSCLEAVLQAQEVIDESGLVPDLADQFIDLKAMLLDYEATDLAEQEVAQVEEATNRLLGFLKPFLELTGAEMETDQVLN